jgi:hypothetical protein
LSTVLEPRLIELCFQTAGLWEMGVQHRMGLPQHVDCVYWCGIPDARVRLYAVVTPNPVHGTFDAAVVDANGLRYAQLTGYRTIAIQSAVNADVKTLEAMLSPAPVAA